MSEQLRELQPVQAVMLVGRSHVVRRLAEGAGIDLGTAPYDAVLLDAAWAKIVEHPIPDDSYEWVVGSFGALLIEHFRARYGFSLKELEDEHGVSVCLVEDRSGIRLYPLDIVQRRIAEQQSNPFAPLFQQIAGVMARHGVA